MKKLFTVFTFILALSFSRISVSQVSLYTFSQSAGTYTEITGDTTVAAATGTTGTSAIDDENFVSNTLPFQFFFNNLPYTNIVINSNGFISFGTSLPAPSNAGCISNNGVYDGAIGAYSRDLIGNRGITATQTSGSNILTAVPTAQFSGLSVGNLITGAAIPALTTITALNPGAGTITISANATATTTGTCLIATGSIVRGTTGVAGSRVHTIQFKNFRNLSVAANSNCLNLQIRLYETSNNIELVYGTCTVSSTISGQVGLRGTSNQDFNNRNTATANWATTVAGTIAANTLTMSTTISPLSGTTFKWTAPAVPSCNMILSNLNPVGTYTPGCSTILIAPKANIYNIGTMTQTAISVNYEVISQGYSETVSGLSLNSGANMEVVFPNTLVVSSNTLGTIPVKITVNSTCNSGSVMYTLDTSYIVENPNFGGPVEGYFFANSTPDASCAPNQPIFYWEDTTGSTSLIENGADVSSGLLTGTVDNGYFSLGNILDAGHKFRYMGTDYDSFYVNTNGFILFSKEFSTLAQINTTVPKIVPATTTPRPAIFPFWYNLNYSDADVPVTRLSYKSAGNKLIITYDRAPISGAAANADDYVSFQVILETPDSPVNDGMIITQFDELKTGAGFLSKYNTNSLSTHTIGIQNVAGDSAIQYRRSNVGGPIFGSSLALAFGPNESVLPVELTSFNSVINGREVTLNWTTSSELNNSGFDIERSSGNSSWTKIGNISGNGTTTSQSIYSFSDGNLSAGSYSYRLKQIDFNGNFEYFNLSNEVNIGVPGNFALSQNYPNPFNPTTRITYDLPVDSRVNIKLFDMSGREVMTVLNETKTAGYYSVNFNGANLSSGVYFYRISAEGNGKTFVATKKMALIK